MEKLKSGGEMTPARKLLSVILGACAGGFMWHARGTNGFGSFWGLVAVGSVLTALICAFYSHRFPGKKALVPFCALSLGITVYCCGSVPDLCGGIIISDAVFKGETEMRLTPCSRTAGTFLMFLAGFALTALFGMFIGSLFSKKEYKFPHYAVFVAEFFGAELLAKATFSHNVLHLLLPEFSGLLEEGLIDAGIGGTAKQAYLAHFSDLHWANDVPYAYPYFEEIEHISFAFAALVIILTAFFVLRDRKGALIALGIDTAAGIAYPLANFFNINGEAFGIFNEMNLPHFLKITDWGLWEFFTGFFMGLGIMLVLCLVRYDGKPAGQKFTYFGDNRFNAVFTMLFFGFVYIVQPCRALGTRIGYLFEKTGVTGDREPLATILIVVFAVASVAALALINRQYLKDGAEPRTLRDELPLFSHKLLFRISLYYCVVYFCAGSSEYITAFLAREAYGGYLAALTSDYFSPVFPMTFAAVIFALGFIPLCTRKAGAARKSGN